MIGSSITRRGRIVRIDHIRNEVCSEDYFLENRQAENQIFPHRESSLTKAKPAQLRGAAHVKVFCLRRHPTLGLNCHLS